MSKLTVYERPEYNFEFRVKAVDTWRHLDEPELKRAIQAVNEHYGLRLGKQYLVAIKRDE